MATHEAVVIHPNERKERVVPGNPVSYHELSPQGAKSMAMFHAKAAPGEGTGRKALHHGGDETLYVLSGTFELEVDGRKDELGPGDSVFIPRGSDHRLTNIGSTAGEAIFVISPPEY